MTPLQKFPKNVRDLGKLVVAKGFKKLRKSKNSPNLVTLPGTNQIILTHFVYLGRMAVGKYGTKTAKLCFLTAKKLKVMSLDGY